MAFMVVTVIAVLIWGTPENVITACEGAEPLVVEASGRTYVVGADYGGAQLLKGDGSYVVRRIPCD